MGAEITFKRPDGADAKDYLTISARGDAPGVVVIQELAWGRATAFLNKRLG
jgi:carboxymethylenebutenolidase